MKTTFDADNPRLTAYALGELDPTETAAIEQQLKNDASLRQAVEEIRQAASMLRAELAGEAGPGLTELQRQRIVQRPRAVTRTPFVFRARAIWSVTALAAAACLVIVVFVWNSNSPSNDRVTIRQNEKTPANGGVSDMLLGMPVEKTAESLTKDAIGRELAERTDAPAIHSVIAPATNQAMPGPAGGEGSSGGSAAVADGVAKSLSGGLAESASVMKQLDEQRARSVLPSVRPEAPTAAAPPPPPPSPPPGPAGGRAGARKAATDADRPSPAEPAKSLDENLRRSAAPADDRKKEADKSVTGEKYGQIIENEFVPTSVSETSSFSVDVDTASYSNVRRFINDNKLPPPDAVRLEEMINYFPYRYDPPSGGLDAPPFSANVEVNAAPWNTEHRLVRIGLRGRDVRPDMRPPTSIVFLIDVSGSMGDREKLPLVKESLKMLVDELNADDRLGIVTYAGEAGRPLDSTFCTPEKKPEILKTIDGLSAGGSTNGAGGIDMAYGLATANYIKGGVNRVILCTDGDFNVGVSSEAELVSLIQQKRATGVYLSVLGFGKGNIQDGKMKQLALHGNGNFAYIDSVNEGKKVLVDQMSGTLVTIAKDVKIQVAFNPAKVGSYRLLGYENRVMTDEDFKNDLKDAGEIGAGHTVTALYEVVPTPAAEAKAMAGQGREASDNAAGAAVAPAANGDQMSKADAPAWKDEMLVLRIRYKEPDGTESKPLEFKTRDSGGELASASSDFKFAASVAAFGMILRDSPHKGAATIESVIDLAYSTIDPEGGLQIQSRDEFITLMEQAQRMIKARKPESGTPTVETHDKGK